MNILIKGTTGRTITFNTVGLILRGKEEASLDVTPEAYEEIKQLERLNLVKVLNKDERKNSEESTTTPEPVVKDPDEPVSSSKVNEDEVEELKINDLTKSLIRKKIKKEKAKNNQKEKNNKDADLGSSKATVSLGDKCVSADMKKMTSDPESVVEKVSDSIDAMEKLENEEASKDLPIDDKKLDENQKMNRSATVSTTEGETVESLKNSIIPEMEEIKDRDPFIDKEEKDNEDKKAPKNAFIDQLSVDEDEDNLGEQFIEL